MTTPAPAPAAPSAPPGEPAAAPGTTAAGTAPAPVEEGAAPQTAEAAEPAEVERVLGVGAKGDINNPAAVAAVDETGNEVAAKAPAEDEEKSE